MIERDSFPPDILRGVEAANRLVEQRMQSLEGYDITARWHFNSEPSKPNGVVLDLIAEHHGRQYSAKGYSYPPGLFLRPVVSIPSGFWDQERVFLNELTKLNLDDLKAQQARAREYELVGAE